MTSHSDHLMTTRTARFLELIDPRDKAAILDSIAEHYGVTPEKAFAEVTAPTAEHLLDYMVEPHRSAASVLMQIHGMRGY